MLSALLSGRFILTICAFLLGREVERMKFDSRLVSGIFIGMVLGLHFHTQLVVYLPILMVVAVALVLRSVAR